MVVLVRYGAEVSVRRRCRAGQVDRRSCESFRVDVQPRVVARASNIMTKRYRSK
jgi:hypothetical protein